MDKEQELEALVQRMIDGGESEENIALVVKNWDAINIPAETPNEPAAENPTTNAGVIAEPGALTALGVGAGGAMKAAPAIMQGASKVMGSPTVQKAAKTMAGLAGAGTGAVVGSMAGGPIGHYAGIGAGGALGYKGGKKLAGAMGRGAEMLQNAPAAASHQPYWAPLGSSLKGTRLLGSALRGAAKASAPIAAGLTLLDLAQMLMGTDAGKAMRNAVAARGQGFMNLDPRAAMGEMPVPQPQDDDEMLAELMGRVGPMASH